MTQQRSFGGFTKTLKDRLLEEIYERGKPFTLKEARDLYGKIRTYPVPKSAPGTVDRIIRSEFSLLRPGPKGGTKSGPAVYGLSNWFPRLPPEDLPIGQEWFICARDLWEFETFTWKKSEQLYWNLQKAKYGGPTWSWQTEKSIHMTLGRLLRTLRKNGVIDKLRRGMYFITPVGRRVDPRTITYFDAKV